MSSRDPGQEERDAALRSNDAFYRAFAGGDFSAMDSLWARAEAVLCIHPGGAPIHGREAVMQSWRDILSAPPPIEHVDARVEIVRGVAFVTCVERVAGRPLAATNVFVWEGARWRLTHHQAGAIAPQPSVAPGSTTVH
jgi:ketosteroid isomerase-like protein